MAIESGGYVNQYVKKRDATRSAPVINPPRITLDSIVGSAYTAPSPAPDPFEPGGAGHRVGIQVSPYAGMTNQEMNALINASQSNAGGTTASSGPAATQTTTAPAAAVVGPTTVKDILAELGLTGVTEAQLTATLESLAAEYGMQLADLLNERALFIDDYGNPGPLVKQALNDLQRKYSESREGAISDLLSRGIFRSGIAAEDIGKIERSHAEGMAGVFRDQQSNLSGIQASMDALKRTLATREAEAKANIDMQNLQLALQARLGGL